MDPPAGPACAPCPPTPTRSCSSMATGARIPPISGACWSLFASGRRGLRAGRPALTRIEHPWHAALGTRAVAAFVSWRYGRAVQRHRPVARDPRRPAAPPRYARPGLRLAGRDGREGGGAGRAHRGGARRAPRAARRPLQGVGHRRREPARRLRLSDRRAARGARGRDERARGAVPASRSSQPARSLGRVPNLALAPGDIPGALQVAFACYALAVWLLRDARGSARHHGRARDRRADADGAAAGGALLVDGRLSLPLGCARRARRDQPIRVSAGTRPSCPACATRRSSRGSIIRPGARSIRPARSCSSAPSARVAPDSMLALKVALGIAELAALGTLLGLLRALGSARRPPRHLRVESAPARGGLGNGPPRRAGAARRGRRDLGLRRAPPRARSRAARRRRIDQAVPCRAVAPDPGRRRERDGARRLHRRDGGELRAGAGRGRRRARLAPALPSGGVLQPRHHALAGGQPVPRHRRSPRVGRLGEPPLAGRRRSLVER